MRKAPCPSCGAEVEFKTSISLVTVCAYCQTLCLRKDLDVENLGKVGQLQPDGTLLQIGTEGRFKGKRFEVMGRIQVKFPQGFWNEWFIRLDGEQEGWIGEAQGTYAVSFRVAVKEPIPAFKEMKVDRAIRLNGELFRVRDVQEARVIGAEGELPFSIRSGYEAPVVDLAQEGTRFATIDYSESPPYVFVGDYQDFDDLEFSRLREPEPAEAKAGGFTCPNCGGGVEIRDPDHSKIVACAYCGSIIDAADPNHKLLTKYKQKISYQPLVPIGAKGKVRGHDWECLGLQRRSVTVEGTKYTWSEYLVWNPKQGYRWLHEFRGHWAWIKTCTGLPKISGATVQYIGHTFKPFQTAKAIVEYCIGEFPWVIKRGDTSDISDYVAPPYILSREKQAEEVVWSLGEYVSGETIWKAFGLPAAPPKAWGIAPAQPSPYQKISRSMAAMFAIFLAAVFLLQIGGCLLQQNKLAHDENFVVNLGSKSGGRKLVYEGGRFVWKTAPTVQKDAEVSRITKPFELAGRTSNIRVKLKTDLNNNWGFFNLSLIEEKSGRALHFGREVSYYHGVSGGESWSEGGNDDSVTLASVPSGRWRLFIQPEGSAPRISFRVQVYRDVPRWDFFFLALGLLIPPYLWFLYRRRFYEYKRWLESDYPMLPLFKSKGSDE